MKVTSATNERTVISFLDRDSIHIDAVPVLFTNDHKLIKTSLLVAILNSFLFDYLMRVKTSGICINYYRLEETPLPKYEDIEQFIKIKILEILARLSFIHEKFSPDWLLIVNLSQILRSNPWKKNWAITKHVFSLKALNLLLFRFQVLFYKLD
ncbi:unnamed protein product [marine sediment metagenome]|uniref:Uncharacterized protein n=1 Tax=marine sediment metagenome TaxID=412755 RepID=X1JRM5_9ZZZZ